MTPQYFFYRTDGLLQRVIVDDIIYLEAGSNYTYLYTLKVKHTVRATLDTTLKQLPGKMFARANRSQAVALKHVDKVTRDSIIFHYEIEGEITLSRQYYDDFVAQLTVLESNPTKLQLLRQQLPTHQLSQKNVVALLFDINHDIEENADFTVRTIIEDKKPSLVYPHNNGLTDAEKAALNQLTNNEDLRSALKKVLADHAAGRVFNVFQLLDGAVLPGVGSEVWTGVKLVDEDTTPGTIPFDDTLHNAFFETYYNWAEIKGLQDWQLGL